MSRERNRPNFFAGPYLDRRAELRERADWIEEARRDASTLYVAAHGTTQLIHLEPEPRIAFLTGDHPAVRAARPEQLVLLGWFRGTRCMLVELDAGSWQELTAGQSFEELRPLSTCLPAEEAGLLAYARALTIWRARQRFCGVCGAATRPERAGHLIRCTNESCGQEFFPRIDPAIIVLVTDGERALLGRQASWPPGRYSTIAGFVEPGESLEDAVIREVDEETGVRIHDIVYDSSQPWPFPASLMLGFYAAAQPAAPITVGWELEDARWFTRDELEAGAVLLPPPQSISYRLIRTWMEGAHPPLRMHGEEK